MIHSRHKAPRLRLLLLSLPLLLFGPGCKLLARAWESLPAGNVTPLETNVAIQPTTAPFSPPASTLSPTPTFQATASPTRLSPTLTPTTTPTEFIVDVSPTPLPLELQMQVFDELWNIVDEEYLYSDYNGLDWSAIYTEYRLRIKDGLDNAAFYAAMEEMIFRLGDEHSAFLSPEEAIQEDAEFAGELDYVGIGILASPVPDQHKAVVVVVFPGSPAQEAGMQTHDSILEVNGQPLLNEEGYLRDVLRGAEGSQVDLLVQTPGEEPRPITLTRRRVEGSVPVPFEVLTTASGKRVGYILVVTFTDQTIVEQVGKALQMMSFDQPLDGVIVDNRMNGGGSDGVLSGTLAYFTHGKMGSFVSRNDERPFYVQKRDMFGSQQAPLVVLVGEETVSFGEIFAGILQDTGRATLIGETTLGNVEILWGYDFEDGSRAWIAHDTFQPLNGTDQDWEKTGIIPDIEMPAGWDEFTLETDPAVKAALAFLDQ